MRELTIQLSSRIEDGESIMLLMTAKARYFQMKRERFTQVFGQKKQLL